MTDCLLSQRRWRRKRLDCDTGGLNPFLLCFFVSSSFFSLELVPSVLFLFLKSFIFWPESLPLLTLFCFLCLSNQTHEPATSSFFFSFSFSFFCNEKKYTYFNICHIYHLFCFWVDQIREPLSHIFLFIYLWDASSILIPLSIIQVSKTLVYLLLSIYLFYYYYYYMSFLLLYKKVCLAIY